MNNKQPLTIVLTGGGSGGHVTPILSLAHELKKTLGTQVVYIGHKGDSYNLSADLDVIESVQGGKFRRYHGNGALAHLLDIKTLLLNIRDFFRVLVAILKARRILKKYKPSVVFSKGSFVAVPVGIAARSLGIPIVTHDSDSIPGLANRIIGRWATINATGMPSGSYPYPEHKIRYVGVPIDNRLKKLSSSEQSKIKSGLGINGRLLLVAGGGNGSRTLNELLFACAPQLLSRHKDLSIVNLAGKAHATDLISRYKESNIDTDRLRVMDYSAEAYKLIAAADLIISRAGATFISEFAVAAKPCIIIPSPFLAEGHQLRNAQALSEQNAAVVLPNEVSKDKFLATINELMTNDKLCEKLASNLNKMAKLNSTSQIANIVLQVARGRVN